jgi:TolA-binding protein
MTPSGEGAGELIRKGILCKDSGKLEEARAAFKEAENRFPDHPRAEDAAYYYGICWYNERNWRETIAAFNALIEKYPGCPWIPEAYFHIGKSYGYLGERERGNAVFEKIIKSYPGSQWANFAAEWKK